MRDFYYLSCIYLTIINHHVFMECMNFHIYGTLYILHMKTMLPLYSLIPCVKSSLPPHPALGLKDCQWRLTQWVIYCCVQTSFFLFFAETRELWPKEKYAQISIFCVPVYQNFPGGGPPDPPLTFHEPCPLEKSWLKVSKYYIIIRYWFFCA